MIFKFYDTCSLLEQAGYLTEEDFETMIISSITLDELENIKTSFHKDNEVKFAARKVLHLLDKYYGIYEIVTYQDCYMHPTLSTLTETNDIKIISCACYWQTIHPTDEVIFYTNDISCKNLAHLTDLTVQSVDCSDFDYDGYMEIYMDAEEMTDFYMNPTVNKYNQNINEYLIVYDKETNEVVDRVCWTGTEYRRLSYNTFSSRHFGDIKPISGDVYQALLADSLVNNKITMVKGPAGSGKTFLSLAYLLHRLERGKIDKIIIFCNTVATKGSARLGFYPGTRDEKLLDSQIGNLLISKLGGRIAVEQLMNEEKLVLLPLSDIRGYDTSGMRAGIYISEAQNLDIDLMKLTLQRIGEDGICIIDGDCKTQVDDITFAGSNNGMKRVSQVYRGEDIYGEITLKNIHRSRIAQIAEKL